MAIKTSARAAISVAIALSGVTVLAACQQDGMRADLSPTPGYGLHFVDEGERAKLAYGQANSDNVGLMLECAKGSRSIEISEIARNNDRKLMLKSGDLRSDFGGVVTAGPGQAILTANGKTDTPALKGFRDTGKIEVQTGGRRYGVNASGSEHADVKRFFAACERA